MAATEDMAARFASLFGTDMADRLTFKTINGICAGIIHTYGRKTGRTPFALLNDEKVIADTLAKIYQKTERTYATESDLQTVRTLITYIKNSMLTDAEIREMDKTADMKISAIYKEYNTWLREQKLMDYDDVALEFTPDALGAIADKAIERNIGARGLRAVMESLLTKIMYDIPSDPTIVKVTITEDCVKNGAEPVVERDLGKVARRAKMKSGKSEKVSEPAS